MTVTANDPALQILIDRVRSAQASGAQLCIQGGGTKGFYGETLQGEPLDTRVLEGISSYEPTELVVTARCGTSLAQLEAVLAEQGQCLPFEPPHFAPGATVGGMVAAGLAGPSRATVGSVRDFVLGATLLTGRGDVMSFGGQVMKNVAGYDVARVLAGSLGTLGLIAEVSLKVLPMAPGHGDAALQDVAGPGTRAAQSLGRPAAAFERQRVVGRHPGGPAARRARRRACRDERSSGEKSSARTTRRPSGQACVTTATSSS